MTRTLEFSATQIPNPHRLPVNTTRHESRVPPIVSDFV